MSTSSLQHPLVPLSSPSLTNVGDGATQEQSLMMASLPSETPGSIYSGEGTRSVCTKPSTTVNVAPIHSASADAAWKANYNKAKVNETKENRRSVPVTATGNLNVSAANASARRDSSQVQGGKTGLTEDAEMACTTLTDLNRKFVHELEFMRTEFRKLEQQLLCKNPMQQHGNSFENVPALPPPNETPTARQRREKLQSFIRQLEDIIEQLYINDGEATATAEQVANLEQHITKSILPVKARLLKQLQAQGHQHHHAPRHHVANTSSFQGGPTRVDGSGELSGGIHHHISVKPVVHVRGYEIHTPKDAGVPFAFASTNRLKGGSSLTQKLYRTAAAGLKESSSARVSADPPACSKSGSMLPPPTQRVALPKLAPSPSPCNPEGLSSISASSSQAPSFANSHVAHSTLLQAWTSVQADVTKERAASKAKQSNHAHEAQAQGLANKYSAGAKEQTSSTVTADQQVIDHSCEGGPDNVITQPSYALKEEKKSFVDHAISRVRTTEDLEAAASLVRVASGPQLLPQHLKAHAKGSTTAQPATPEPRRMQTTSAKQARAPDSIMTASPAPPASQSAATYSTAASSKVQIQPPFSLNVQFEHQVTAPVMQPPQSFIATEASQKVCLGASFTPNRSVIAEGGSQEENRPHPPPSDQSAAAAAVPTAAVASQISQRGTSNQSTTKTKRKKSADSGGLSKKKKRKIIKKTLKRKLKEHMLMTGEVGASASCEGTRVLSDPYKTSPQHHHNMSTSTASNTCLFSTFANYLNHNRFVEYTCASCNEVYSKKISLCIETNSDNGTADKKNICNMKYNPWWGLKREACPKCREQQIPRIDISAPSNLLEYHPALLAHINDDGSSNHAASSLLPPMALLPPPTPPLQPQALPSGSPARSESPEDGGTHSSGADVQPKYPPYPYGTSHYYPPIHHHESYLRRTLLSATSSDWSASGTSSSSSSESDLASAAISTNANAASGFGEDSGSEDAEILVGGRAASTTQKRKKGNGNGNIVKGEILHLGGNEDTDYDDNGEGDALEHDLRVWEKYGNEDYGSAFAGPQFSDLDSARTFILMDHASTCPGRHKNRTHGAVCQNVKFIMLHIRDCPGTLTVYPPLPLSGDAENKVGQSPQPHEHLPTSHKGNSASVTQPKDDPANDRKTDDTSIAQPPPTTEPCPFPWCRSMKHLLHHLINCTSGRACRMCHPKAISDNMATLAGLNRHRRQKRRPVFKAVSAGGDGTEAITGTGGKFEDISAANGTSVSADVAVNANTANPGSTATKPMPQAPQHPKALPPSQPPVHQPVQRYHVPPEYPPQQQIQSPPVAAEGSEVMQMHSTKMQSLQHPGSIIAQGRSSVTQCSASSHEGSCTFVERSQQPAAPLPTNQGARDQVPEAALSMEGLQSQTSPIQGGYPVVMNARTQQCSQLKNHQQQQQNNMQKQQKTNSQHPEHPHILQNAPIPQPQSAEQHALETQELLQNPLSQPLSQLPHRCSQQHQKMQPRESTQTVAQQQHPLKAGPIVQGHTLPPANHQAAVRDPPPNFFPVASGSTGLAPPTLQLEPTHHNFHFLSQRSCLGHRRANSLPSLALAGASAGLRPFDFANIMTARPLGMQQMPASSAQVPPAPDAAALVAPAAPPLGTRLTVQNSIPQFCGSSAPINNVLTAIPSASRFPASNATASNAATAMTCTKESESIRGAWASTKTPQTKGQGDAVLHATLSTSAAPTTAVASHKRPPQTAAQVDPEHIFPVSNPPHLAVKNSLNARGGPNTASIHTVDASSAIRRMKTTLCVSASAPVSGVTSATAAKAQNVLSQAVSAGI